MKKSVYDLQAYCQEAAAGLRATAREVHEEIGAADVDQGTADAWERIKKDLGSAGDLLNDLLNNLRTITGGPEGGESGG